MAEDSVLLHDRARRYRQLATMVTDDKLMDVLLTMADELDARGRAAEGSSHSARETPSTRSG
jgi:hypothetical protein